MKKISLNNETLVDTDLAVSVLKKYNAVYDGPDRAATIERIKEHCQLMAMQEWGSNIKVSFSDDYDMNVTHFDGRKSIVKGEYENQSMEWIINEVEFRELDKSVNC